MKLKQPTEILPLEERISIIKSKTTSLENSKNNTELKSLKINLPFKESERLLKRLKLSYPPLDKPKSTCPICLPMLLDLSICKSQLPELN